MTWTLSAFADEAGGSTDAQIKALQRAGIDRIDPRSVDGHNIVDLPLDLAEKVRARYDAAGITVNMYGSPIGKIDIADDVQTDLDRLAHLGRLKDIFGCNAVRIFSYYNKQNAPKDAWKARAVDNLKRLCDLAARLDLVLYHENESHIYGDATDDVLDLAGLRDGSTFMLIYDFANYIRTGEDGWQSWQKMKGTTDYFPFKDQKKSGEHVPMGQGETHAFEILKDAADSGWSGGCTLEPHLKHSAAVLATHAAGEGMKALKDMTEAECFQVAADGAIDVLRRIGKR